METNKGRALVVDDEEMIRSMLTDVLEAFGYEVDAAESGEAALAHFVAGRYRVVLTDLLMPGMSGLDVVTELRRVEPALPAILLTGLGNASTAANARQEGVLVLYKPVSLDKLMAALETTTAGPVGA